VDGAQLTADYWYANARQPVVFDAVMRQLLADGCRMFVESSAHPVLVTAMAATANELGYPATITGTLRRGAGGVDHFCTALAAVPIPAAAMSAA
jgi:acyl transferase domain-containing protein